MPSDARSDASPFARDPTPPDDPRRMMNDPHTTTARIPGDALPCANMFLIGAQKAGTTYLASLLGKHPDICVSHPKETHFFTTHFDEDGARERYARSFAQPEAKIRLDASTTYSFLRPVSQRGLPDVPGHDAPVPERIRDACPEARFLYLLRDPVERAASAMRHSARTDPAIAGEISLVDAMMANPMIALIGRYGDQVERYLEVFDRDRFLFIDFADLREDIDGMKARIGAFLGLDLSGLDPKAAEAERHAGGNTLTPLGRLMHSQPGFREAMRAFLPDRLRAGLRDRVLSRPSELRLTGQAGAAEMFRADLDKLEALTGLRLRRSGPVSRG